MRAVWLPSMSINRLTKLGETLSHWTTGASLTRTISSRVAVRSGESVVLGGLIKENASEAEDWPALAVQGAADWALVWHHHQDPYPHRVAGHPDTKGTL